MKAFHAARSCSRIFARATGTRAKLPPHKLMPMTRLSPSMTSGKLLRWRVEEGAALPESGSETICDVLPTGLTDDPDDGDPVLEIEAHEEGFLARILLKEGDVARPDEAIAVVVEDAADIARVSEAYAAAASGPALLVEPATFAWQAYLGSGESTRQCSNS